MSNSIATVAETSVSNEVNKVFSTFYVANQLIGIPVLQVEDVLNSMPITWIPLSAKEIAGLLNLRGRIVTAIDLRARLGLPESEDKSKSMSIVVERKGELYSLIFDKVSDVMSLKPSQYEQSPANLEQVWAEVSEGVYRLDKEIMLVLNIEKLLNFS
ncbi:MAG: chemotaxis protein CheW [Alphaproteobacteria bacterium CG11_big_fil_rev_8_21_14_0_20_44_7]|nr:MAG: chemotaxis protein CheW [Alphaproteobacteria bacterium CG11_big_fil_rev_8_21_14_0_20_44_7]